MTASAEMIARHVVGKLSQSSTSDRESAIKYVSSFLKQRPGCRRRIHQRGRAWREAAEDERLTYAQCIEARRLLGLSQSVVAKAVGVSVARISNYETGVELVEDIGSKPGVRLRKVDA